MNRWASDADLARTAAAADEAHGAVVRAKAERAYAVRAALAAGHSTRSLAPVLGVGHNTIARWAKTAPQEKK
jgi:transposase-like protein